MRGMEHSISTPPPFPLSPLSLVFVRSPSAVAIRWWNVFCSFCSLGFAARNWRYPSDVVFRAPVPPAETSFPPFLPGLITPHLRGRLYPAPKAALGAWSALAGSTSSHPYGHRHAEPSCCCPLPLFHPFALCFLGDSAPYSRTSRTPPCPGCRSSDGFAC